MAKKKASSTLYFIFFFIIFLAFCAFAVDGAIVLTNRAKLQNITEASALAGISEFKSDTDPTINIINTAKSTFNLLKQDCLKAAIIDDPPIVNIGDQTVTVTTHMISKPFFLSFLGVTGINLNAKATAVSESPSVYTAHGGINWLTKYKPYQTDIIDSDSAVLQSLITNANASYDSSTGKVKWLNIRSNIGAGQSTSAGTYPLSLGPGGFVTIKLPTPIINKPGDDLYIEETGSALEGYMVFAGLDVDPDKPYSDYTMPANTGELKWVNISCSGTPVTSLGSHYSAHPTASSANLSGAKDKFYGSGNFDLGNSCLSGNVNMVKYIRIVDDNEESAYIKDPNGIYYQTMLYGESSTTTPGADIDYVQVLNYVHLK